MQGQEAVPSGAVSLDFSLAMFLLACAVTCINLKYYLMLCLSCKL